MKNYTEEDKNVWKILFERQEMNLKGKVCDEYSNALRKMSPVMNANEIPNFEKINDWFESSTKWKIEIVPGLIPVIDFFSLLAEKKFCSSTWLRKINQLDYLEEPDMFHDTFGHIPLLSNPIFSDFMQTFGDLGLRNQHNPETVLQLQRLYWYTIEFGMIDLQNPKIYGAGIISSFGESNRSVSPEVKKISYNIEEIFEKSFKTDEIQEEYVCIESFSNLFNSITNISEKLCQIG